MPKSASYLPLASLLIVASLPSTRRATALRIVGGLYF